MRSLSGIKWKMKRVRSCPNRHADFWSGNRFQNSLSWDWKVYSSQAFFAIGMKWKYHRNSEAPEDAARLEWIDTIGRLWKFRHVLGVPPAKASKILRRHCWLTMQRCQNIFHVRTTHRIDEMKWFQSHCNQSNQMLHRTTRRCLTVSIQTNGRSA